MLLRFTKLDDRRHVLAVEVAGRAERVELETRSTLHHDLTHLAVEELAPVTGGFFVALAAGTALDDVARQAQEGWLAGTDAMRVERAVAVLQRLAKVDEDPAALHARIVASLAVQDEAPPDWFTPALVAGVRERLRALVGRWRATPYGGTMEVAWERRVGR